MHADGPICTHRVAEAILLHPRLLQEGACPEGPAAAAMPLSIAHPSGLAAKKSQAIGSLAGAVCFQHHLSQGPMAVASRICTTPMTGESEEPCGKTAVGCLNSPATPRANSSRLQRNCCELQVASGSMSSRAGSQPKDRYSLL